jgi:hypothetical protein
MTAAAPPVAVVGAEWKVDNLARPTLFHRRAIFEDAGDVPTSGLMLGQEVLASTGWADGLVPVTALAGVDGWLRLVYIAMQPLSIGWVEVVAPEIG